MCISELYDVQDDEDCKLPLLLHTVQSLYNAMNRVHRNEPYDIKVNYVIKGQFYNEIIGRQFFVTPAK